MVRVRDRAGTHAGRVIVKIDRDCSLGLVAELGERRGGGMPDTIVQTEVVKSVHVKLVIHRCHRAQVV